MKVLRKIIAVQHLRLNPVSAFPVSLLRGKRTQKKNKKGSEIPRQLAARSFNFFSFLTLIILFPTLFSCEEIMDLNLSGTTVKSLVVEGSITTDRKPHRVTLSYSGDYFNKQDINMATGAEVSITDGTNNYLLHEIKEGVYVTEDSVHGHTGKTYTLNIKLADGSLYKASDDLNPCAGIDSINQTANYNSLISGYGYDVLFYGPEPEPSGNCYMFLLYMNNSLYSDTITEVTFADDEFINGKYVSEYSVYRIRETDLANEPAQVTLEMHSINRNYYEFMMAFMTETIWKGSPWDGPPADIPTNVSNGGKGYFRASEVKRRSKQFVPTPRMN